MRSPHLATPLKALLHLARSFLFVPASQPERYEKALASGADCIVLDLEDAVAPDQKAVARGQLEVQLAGFSRAQLGRILIRINPAGTDWHAQDLAVLAKWAPRGLIGAMVPKAESPSVLREVSIAIGPSAYLVPLIETLAGLDAIDLLARAPQVTRLAFGHLDFQLDLSMRCRGEEIELAPMRFALVAASRRAELAPPIDGVTTDIANAQQTQIDAQRARAFGFGGKLCIHPSQVAAVNEAFSPSAEELKWAQRVVDAAEFHGEAAFSMDGKMVDLPVVRLAERTLQHAKSIQ